MGRVEYTVQDEHQDRRIGPVQGDGSGIKYHVDLWVGQYRSGLTIDLTFTSASIPPRTLYILSYCPPTCATVSYKSLDHTDISAGVTYRTHILEHTRHGAKVCCC